MSDATDVVGLTGLEVLADVSHCVHSVGKKRGCATVPPKDGKRKVIEGAVKETTVYRTIWTIVFARSISVEKAHDDGFGAILNSRISDLHFVHPLCHRVIIHLVDFILIHDRLNHQLWPVTVNFRRRKVN